MVREKIKGTRITVDLANPRLYRAVRVLAAAQGRPLRDVVSEALRDWVEKQEDVEGLRDFWERGPELFQPPKTRSRK